MNIPAAARRCIYGANLGFAVLGLVSEPVRNKGHPLLFLKASTDVPRLGPAESGKPVGGTDIGAR